MCRCIILIQTKLGCLLDGKMAMKYVRRMFKVFIALDELHDIVNFGVRCVPRFQSAENERAFEILEKATRESTVASKVDCSGLEITQLFQI